MKSGPLFYVAREDRQEAGPYDLVQMAGLLRKKIITEESLTRLEGEADWTPFCERSQFIIAREMSPDAVSMHVEALAREAEAARAPIPLPSREFMVQSVAAVLAAVVASLGVYFVSRADATIGLCLAVAGTGVALAGTCMIYVRLVDEDFLTIVMVFFLPFYDIYYFLANFRDYLPYFCMRYLGGIFVAAAVMGIASSHSADASTIQSFLHLYGQ